MGRYTKYFLLCGIALLSVESFFNNGTVYRLYQKGKKVVMSGITLVGGGDRQQTIAKNEMLLEMAIPREKMTETVLYKKYFVVSYNTEYKNPNWVGWRLTGNHVYGEVKRPSGKAFHKDPDLMDSQADPLDFRGSGYSRGHLCPAGDNRWSREAMYESFCMTNVCPQLEELNTGEWNDLENKCRKWAQRYGVIYIIAGPVYNETMEYVGNTNVRVPAGFFKVILRTGNNPQTIAFFFDNRQNVPERMSVMSVKDIEKLTGLVFFPLLPDELEKKLKSSFNINQWNYGYNKKKRIGRGFRRRTISLRRMVYRTV